MLNPPTHISECLTCGSLKDSRIGYIDDYWHTFESFAEILEEQFNQMQTCKESNCESHKIDKPPFLIKPLEHSTLRYMGVN